MDYSKIVEARINFVRKQTTKGREEVGTTEWKNWVEAVGTSIETVMEEIIVIEQSLKECSIGLQNSIAETEQLDLNDSGCYWQDEMVVDETGYVEKKKKIAEAIVAQKTLMRILKSMQKTLLAIKDIARETVTHIVKNTDFILTQIKK